MSEAELQQEEGNKKGGGGGILAAILALVGGAAGAAGVHFVLPAPHVTCEAAPAEAAVGHGEEAGVGYLLDLPEVVVNLRSEGLARFLRAKVLLELPRQPSEHMDAMMPLLQDTLLTTLSSLTVEEIAADNGHQHVKERIKEAFLPVVGPVRRVLINDFVVQ